VIVGAACAVLYFYSKYSLIVEAKLKEGLRQYTAEIYARPYSLVPGHSLSRSQLEQRLKRLGYVESSNHAPRTFRAGSSSLELVNERGETVDVVFKQSAVSALIADRQAALRVDLEPELISSLSDSSGKKRKYVSYESLPDVLIKAILAAEDKRFFDHSGIDFWRILKAGFVDIRNSGVSQGGSTLTQQYVKNIFLSPEKRFKRKFEEICIALILETRLTKRQIFELYVNEIYLGQRGPYSITGFGQAAALYFHKNVHDLTLSESALLAGIIPAPNRFNPYRYPDRALRQRNQVLDAMEENGFITLNQKVVAKSTPLNLQGEITYNYLEAPYFVDYIEDQLAQRFSREELYKKKFRIYTTLNADLQEAAFEAVREGGAEIDKALAKKRVVGRPQMALVALDPRTGEILAMVGGRSYSQSQYNRIIAAHRQPGSSFKPFVYSAALETPFTEAPQKITPAKTYIDEPYTFYFGNTVYSPKNFGGKYLGLVNLREALIHSLNVATVRLAEEVGYDEVVKVARRAGFGENLKPYPSVALGAFEVTPLELAQGYTIFPNLGLLQRARAIDRVETAGETIRENPPKPEAVIHPETAYLVTSLMQSVLDRGTGFGARQRGFNLPAAGKTGTSNDGWFVGFTPDLLCAAWVGFDDNRDINLLAANSAVPVWAAFMKRAQTLLPLKGADFVRPENVVTVDIDPSTGLLASPRCAKVTSENFILGTAPINICPETQGGILYTSQMKPPESPSAKPTSH
jgi:penicillin-binding protein 1B